MASFLPPLPPSDEEAMQRNKKSGFYDVGAADFWSGSVIEHIEDKPTKKCDHEFMGVEGGVGCRKCHFGFPGAQLEIRGGKLFHNNEQLPI